MITKMSDAIPTAATFAVTRRALVKYLAWGSAALALFARACPAGLITENSEAAWRNAPVVWFYMDRLHLDRTGAAIPYRAPRGMRSGAPLAHLSEEAFRRVQLYV
jgi:hypothetical protein